MCKFLSPNFYYCIREHLYNRPIPSISHIFPTPSVRPSCPVNLLQGPLRLFELLFSFNIAPDLFIFVVKVRVLVLIGWTTSSSSPRVAGPTQSIFVPQTGDILERQIYLFYFYSWNLSKFSFTFKKNRQSKNQGNNHLWTIISILYKLPLPASQ